MARNQAKIFARPRPYRPHRIRDDDDGENSIFSTTLTNTTMASLINLTSSATGSRVLFATDEWFAAADNLLNPSAPEFIPDLYCEQGKVMDGWETRRKRSAGHDWCVIKLGGGAAVHGDVTFDVNSLEVDTAYFTGNQTPRISIEGMRIVRPPGSSSHEESDDYLYVWMPGAVSRLARGGGIQGTGQSVSVIEKARKACKDVALQATNGNSGEWIEILPMTPLKPGYEESRYHSFSISEAARQMIAQMGGITHLKLNYFPDGGVARLKVMGQVFQSTTASSSTTMTAISTQINNNKSTPRIHPHSSSNSPPSSQPYPQPEISCSSHGGLGLECSNKHYGIPMNLLSPTLGKDMGDGWETARHPDRPPVVTKDPVVSFIHASPFVCTLQMSNSTILDNSTLFIRLDYRIHPC
jgi:allantoicase